MQAKRSISSRHDATSGESSDMLVWKSQIVIGAKRPARCLLGQIYKKPERHPIKISILDAQVPSYNISFNDVARPSVAALAHKDQVVIKMHLSDVEVCVIRY